MEDNTEKLGTKEKDENLIKIQLSLPHELIINLDYVAGTEWKTRSGTASDLLKWALESIDPETQKLPDVHPDGKTREEVLSSIPNLRARFKEAQKTPK